MLRDPIQLRLAEKAPIKVANSHHPTSLPYIFDNRVARMAQAARRTLAAAWTACGAFEWIAFSYLGTSIVLIALFGDNLAHPRELIALQLFVSTVIFSLCYFAARAQREESAEGITVAERVWHFWRHWYPHLFFLFCFEELGYLVHVFYPGWQDAKLIAFDHWLTGVQPSIWLEQFATPLRTDFMQFAYFTYFIFLLLLGGILYYRRDWRAYWSVMTYSAAAYAMGYVIAIFFPIESPWFAMAGAWHGELHGRAFASLMSLIEHYGRVRGAAFPSEHVAGSCAALWGAWRHRRWLFWAMLPFLLCMCVATIYGRYHYVADVFAGMITGTLGYFVGRWIMKRHGALVETKKCVPDDAGFQTSRDWR